MKFYIGPAGVPLSSRSDTTQAGIERVAELGLNLMEVEFVQGVKMRPENAKPIKAVAESLGVKLSCHGPYFINLNAIEDVKVMRSRQHILAAAQIAHELGAYIVVFHAGYYLGMEKEKVAAKIKQELGECVSRMEQNGWDVLLGLETTGKHSAWGTIEETATMSREFKNVVPVIDFAHVYARSGGKMKKSADFEAVMKQYDSLKPKLLHSHFSCIKYSDKGELSHLTMEESSEPDFKVIAPVLKRRNYDIALVSESPALERDALRMKKILGV